MPEGGAVIPLLMATTFMFWPLRIVRYRRLYTYNPTLRYSVCFRTGTLVYFMCTFYSFDCFYIEFVDYNKCSAAATKRRYASPFVEFDPPAVR